MEGEIASRRVTEEVIGPVEELDVVHHTDLHMGGERETKTIVPRMIPHRVTKKKKRKV